MNPNASQENHLLMLKEMIAIPVFGTTSSGEGLNSNSQIPEGGNVVVLKMSWVIN
jgi:hypothetical protein